MNTEDSVMSDKESAEVAYEWLAMAHPHEAYADDPERFWALFQKKCPGLSRQDMEKLLKQT